MATKKTETKAAKKRYVLVRTYSAGVHVGELTSQTGSTVRLEQARNLWQWSGGRLALNDVVVQGVRTGDKLTGAVPGVELLGAIAIYDVDAAAEKTFREAQTWTR